jgi:uncharacterized repeat protein (TIGR01451 family)
MRQENRNMIPNAITDMKKWLRLVLPLFAGILMLSAALSVLHQSTSPVLADPIAPPEGYPKLSLSVMSVTPTLATKGGATLAYAIEIRNTGAYSAAGATLVNRVPANTVYNNDALATTPAITASNNVLTWSGDIGFDDSVVISYTVTVSAAFEGKIENTAVVTHPLIARPVALTAETIITNDPLLSIEKSAVPALPGANQPMTYTIVVANRGQPAVNRPITVTVTKYQQIRHPAALGRMASAARAWSPGRRTSPWTWAKRRC